MTALAISLILLGIIVLLYGTRLALLAVGVGALLGTGILHLLPGPQGDLFSLLLPLGLAIVFAFGANIARGIFNLVVLALGALAGGAIVFAILDLFALDFGLTNWVLALVGAVVGAVIFTRLVGWPIMILAGIVGALLFVRGFQLLVPEFDGFLASVIAIALAVISIAYQRGLFRGRKSRTR